MKSIVRNMLVSLATVVGAFVWLAGAAFADPPQGMRLYVFSSGWLTLDKSGLQTGATGKITVPVAFFLIKHPKGNVLFDTGCHPDVATDPQGRWGNLTKIMTPLMQPGDNVINALAGVGLECDDVDVVVCSHLHPDHCGCNTFFKRAT